MKRRFFTMMLAAALLFLYACQPTPDTGYVQQKQGDLTEKIEETAKAGQAPTGVGSHYTLEKTYAESGKTLVVDADITGGDESQMAVLTVAPRYFESGDSLRQMTEGLFPGYTKYKYGIFTKIDLEEQIREMEFQIFRAENGLNPATGEPEDGEAGDYHGPIPSRFGDGEYLTMLPKELLRIWAEEDGKKMLQELQQAYLNAPTDEELGAPDYMFAAGDDGKEWVSILCKKDRARYYVGFCNPGKEGNDAMLWVDRQDGYTEIGNMLEESLPKKWTPGSQVQETTELQKVKEMLKIAGIDYMELYEARQSDKGGEYVFTRSYNGAVEDYAAQYLNLKPTDGDGVVVQRLWEPESFTVEMYEGEIYTIRWYNPSKIIKVDNENTKILSWQEIQTVFERQMGYMLTPGEEQQGWWDPDEVRVERISLELGKVLMKDSGEYKLIPVWNFFGRDDSIGKIEDAEEKCYLSVNALDGTVIDRNLMY